jgi:hypothetical protein
LPLHLDPPSNQAPRSAETEALATEVSRLQGQVNALDTEVTMFSEAVVEQEAAAARAYKATAETRQRSAILRGCASVLSHKTLACQGYNRRLQGLIDLLVQGRENGSR